MIGDAEIRRRFAHYGPAAKAVESHDLLRAAFRGAASLVDDECPDGREKSLAVTALEEAMFWANAAIARPVVPPMSWNPTGVNVSQSHVPAEVADRTRMVSTGPQE